LDHEDFGISQRDIVSFLHVIGDRDWPSIVFEGFFPRRLAIQLHDAVLPLGHCFAEVGKMADGKFDPVKYPLDVVVLTICEDATGKVLRWHAEKLHGQIGQGDVVGVPKDSGGHVNIDGQGLRPAEVDSLKYAPAELDGGKWLNLIGREELATDGDESLGRTLGKQVVEEGNPFQCFDVVAELASH
jgi:hypothetical protein